jgi:hypothetical protein
VGPATATTEVEEDIDDEPPGGALPVGPVAATIEVEEDVDCGLPGGALLVGPAAFTTKVEEDVDGGSSDGDPAVPTINVKKVDGGPPWEVPKLVIQKRPPSTLRNVYVGPARRCWSWRSESAYHQR